MLVSHDVEEALYLADRVLVLSARPRRRGRARSPRRPRGARPAHDAVTDPAFAGRARAAMGALGEAAHERQRVDGAGAARGRGRAARRLGSSPRSWDVLADALDIEPFLVPAPSEIAESLWDDRELLAENAWVTLQEVVAGLAIALVVGYALAVVLHLSPILRRALYPLLVASQTVPVIAIAPILIVWFGFGIGPKLAIIALVCFFPVTVNTLDGLRAVDPALVRMMRTLDAGPLADPAPGRGARPPCPTSSAAPRSPPRSR